MKKKSSRNIPFTHHGREWVVHRTQHLYESRFAGKYARDQYLDSKRYTAIFRAALNHGLTSFRNQSCVVVVPDYTGGYYALLCELAGKTISVITVWKVYKRRNDSGTPEFWRAFIRVPNRINILYGYTVPRMTKQEQGLRQFDQVTNDLDLANQDMDFTYAMQTINDLAKL